MVEDVVTMQVWIKSFWCQYNAINKLQNSNFRNYQWWLPNNLPEVIRLNCYQKKINWNMCKLDKAINADSEFIIWIIHLYSQDG